MNIVDKITNRVKRAKANPFIFENGKPVAQGHHGGLRLRLLTSQQTGLASLMFPIVACLFCWGFLVLTGLM